MRNEFWTELFFMTMVVSIIGAVNSDKSCAPALYVFGDSLFDSGNNNMLPTLARADFMPYGRDFDTGPTGRFTNGRTVVDFFAEFLGLPYPPPYLNMGSIGQSTGINFASASCGILPETGSNLGKCLNFGEQVDMFETMVETKLAKKLSLEEVTDYMSKSVFVVAIGSNDYINNYIDKQLYDTSQSYTPQSYAAHLLQNLSHQLERMYNLGARKVVVFEIGPIGCIPSIARRTKDNGRCNEQINQLAIIFNDQLAPMLKGLTSNLQRSQFILGHAYWLGYDGIINPTRYGLQDSSNPCCITWANGTSACIPALQPCQEPQKHYFWDGYHLTETMYNAVATHCFNGSSVCIPKNILQLVQD